MQSTSQSLKTVTLTSANTEYPVSINPGVRQYAVYTNAASGSIRLAFRTGLVATPTEPYITIPNGSMWYLTDLFISPRGATIYLASATAGLVVNIFQAS